MKSKRTRVAPWRAVRKPVITSTKNLTSEFYNAFNTESGQQLVDSARKLSGLATVVRLLDEGVDPNSFGDEHCGYTALQHGSMAGSTEIVNALLYRGAFVDLCDENGYSPLMAATQYNHPAVVKVLLQHGASINLAADGMTPLQIATDDGKIELVEIFLAHGAISIK